MKKISAIAIIWLITIACKDEVGDKRAISEGSFEVKPWLVLLT